MGYTKEQLLARLKELDVNFIQHEHPVVLTVEAQAQHVGHLGGALSKNLFLKDKKNRFYIVSALADTKVDMKVLSQRLGLGKGGVRMAPEEALAEILQVPLGCVTPFSLVNETARHVSLILDQGFISKECCVFHPLSNDMSIMLSAHDLDKFLKSIGRNPAYVDLEATPVVGKDQPPDLASLVPYDTIALLEPTKLVTTSQVPLQNHDVQDNKPLKVTGKSDKQLNDLKNPKEKPAVTEKLAKTFADSQFFVNHILEKASALVISEITEENVKQHGEQLGAVVSNNIRKHLSSELNNLAALFKNAAYTEGFQAGICSMQILFKG
ncbi:Prolyl-tRNA synthetase associated domain-containing protein [Drosera capensis]